MLPTYTHQVAVNTTCIACLFAGDTLTCPIRVTSAANVPLRDITVLSPWLAAGSCVISTLDPSAASIECVASVLLTPEDFVLGSIHIAGNASADGVPAVAFDTQVSLAVTRSLAVETKPHFKLPSEFATLLLQHYARVLWTDLIHCMHCQLTGSAT